MTYFANEYAQVLANSVGSVQRVASTNHTPFTLQLIAFRVISGDGYQRSLRAN